MFTKLYEKIVQILKENYKFFISLLIVILLCTIRLPYYIDCPGGVIDISKRIEVQDSYETEGSFNLAYVTELKATIPTMIIAALHPDWDILEKQQIVSSNENVEDVDFRDHLLLEEANDNAVLLGFFKAGKEVTITNRKLYVTYLDPISKTDLKIGDQIIAVEGISITSKQQLYELLDTYQAGETISIEVERDHQTIQRYATMLQVEDRVLVGMMISERKEYQLPQTVDLKFPPSESGPSGGFMMALSIYNSLIPYDLTQGKKIVGTGTIDLEGNVGSIGGVKYKLQGAVKAKADLFLVPAGDNYEEAMELKEKRNYKIEIVPIHTFDEAITYLGKGQ